MFGRYFSPHYFGRHYFGRRIATVTSASGASESTVDISADGQGRSSRQPSVGGAWTLKTPVYPLRKHAQRIQKQGSAESLVVVSATGTGRRASAGQGMSSPVLLSGKGFGRKTPSTAMSAIGLGRKRSLDSSLASSAITASAAGAGDDVEALVLALFAALIDLDDAA